MGDSGDARIWTIDQVCEKCPRYRSPRTEIEIAACYELWRRALMLADEEALKQLIALYHRLVAYLLKDFGRDEHNVHLVFIKLWRAYHGPDFERRCPELGCALALLRRCAATTYIDLVRQAARHATMAEVELEDDTLRDARDDRADAMLRDLELQAEIWRRLNGEEERVVFQYSYEHECKPGEIAQIRPDLFTDAHAVSTIKERIKKRLSQDHVLHGLLRG